MLWSFLPIGYCVSVAVETPILMVGLSPAHPLRRRFLAGLWLTACTYPIFILVLPYCFSSRDIYLAVGETFAASAECALFLAAFGCRDRDWTAVWRDCAVIVLANLASFAVGEWMHAHGWFEWLMAGEIY
jgi:hypothetical protein